MSKLRTSNRILRTTAFFCIALAVPLSVWAFESTSATFELHAGDMESVVASSTSATFKLHNAGGQTATASSSLTTTSVSSGILYWLYGYFGARYEQIHYRWRADDGSEVTATFPVNEDTTHVSFPKDTKKRLRFEVSNEGWTRGAAPVFILEVAQTATCSSGTYAAVPTVYGSAWVIATSTNIADGEVTSNVVPGLTDANMTFVQGRAQDLTNTTAVIALTSSGFTEVEYGILATSVATNGATYCFRLTNAGATSGTGYSFVYSQYATAVIASGLSPTGSLDSAVFDTLTPAGPGLGAAYNSIMWNGTEGTGRVRFQLATSDNSAGPWNFYGSTDNGATCLGTSYYDTLTSGAGGGPGKPVELSCAGAYHNNHRYFRYRIQICSSDCSASGVTSPVVSGVVVNWAP